VESGKKMGIPLGLSSAELASICYAAAHRELFQFPREKTSHPALQCSTLCPIVFSLVSIENFIFFIAKHFRDS
jgi:hypothetical protein